jgi:hypothetical protein
MDLTSSLWCMTVLRGLSDSKWRRWTVVEKDRDGEERKGRMGPKRWNRVASLGAEQFAPAQTEFPAMELLEAGELKYEGHSFVSYPRCIPSPRVGTKAGPVCSWAVLAVDYCLYTSNDYDSLCERYCDFSWLRSMTGALRQWTRRNEAHTRIFPGQDPRIITRGSADFPSSWMRLGGKRARREGSTLSHRSSPGNEQAIDHRAYETNWASVININPCGWYVGSQLSLSSRCKQTPGESNCGSALLRRPPKDDGFYLKASSHNRSGMTWSLHSPVMSYDPMTSSTFESDYKQS